MTTFLGQYRGAKIYEIEEFDPSEGKKMEVKILAKAVSPDQENLKVDFTGKASNQKKAIEKVKKAIDHFLQEHGIEEF